MADKQQKQSKPLAEWIAGATGLLLTVSLVGYIGWQALEAPKNVGHPPQIGIEAKSLSRSGSGYVLEFTAHNRSPQTAAQVQVEGTLNRGGSKVATASTTLDYVPGYSVRQGGLYFEHDPRLYDIQLQPLGYADP